MISLNRVQFVNRYFRWQWTNRLSPVIQYKTINILIPNNTKDGCRGSDLDARKIALLTRRHASPLSCSKNKLAILCPKVCFFNAFARRRWFMLNMLLNAYIRVWRYSKTGVEGFLAAGYDRINIDDCYMDSRDPNTNDLRADQTRFPGIVSGPKFNFLCWGCLWLYFSCLAAMGTSICLWMP